MSDLVKTKTFPTDDDDDDDDVFGDDDLDDEAVAAADKVAKAGSKRKRSMFDLEEDQVKAEEDIKQETAEAATSASTSSKSGLTAAQRARAERNRLKALTLKQARLISRGGGSSQSGENTHKVVIDTLTGDRTDITKEKRVVDSGAGFFIEDEEEGAEDDDARVNLADVPAPILEPDRPECLECAHPLADSFLLRTFDLSVCDGCRDTEPDGKHELITKTDAKNTFLLKDSDLDRSDERMATGTADGGGTEELKPLKFIVRKNPHNVRWGDMKLYLRSQVEELALSVWGTEEALERAHEQRDVRKEKAKQKKFDKKMKELRMRVRRFNYANA